MALLRGRADEADSSTAGCGDLDFEASLLGGSRLFGCSASGLRTFLYVFGSGGVSSARDTAALFAFSFTARTALALLGGFDDGGIKSNPRTGACRVSGACAMGGLGGGLG